MSDGASCPACGYSPIGEGRFCAGCGVPLASSNPFEAPAASTSDAAPASPTPHVGGVDVREVAKLQRYIILLILATGAFFAFTTFGAARLGTSATPLLSTAIVPVTLGLALLRIILVYRLAVAVKITVGWAVVAAVGGGLHALVGLVALLMVNQRATDVLKQAGLRVGLFGVRAADLRALP